MLLELGIYSNFSTFYQNLEGGGAREKETPPGPTPTFSKNFWGNTFFIFGGGGSVEMPKSLRRQAAEKTSS